MRIRYNYKGLPRVDEVSSVQCKRLKGSDKVDLIFFDDLFSPRVVVHLDNEYAAFPICEEIYYSGFSDIRGCRIDSEYNEYEDEEEEREEEE